jgi:hypothetical protein
MNDLYNINLQSDDIFYKIYIRYVIFTGGLGQVFHHRLGLYAKYQTSV